MSNKTKEALKNLETQALEALEAQVSELFEFYNQRNNQRNNLDLFKCDRDDDKVELTALYRKIGYIEAMVQQAIKDFYPVNGEDKCLMALTEIKNYLADNF